MTLIQVEKRLAAVEKRLGRLQQSLDYSRAVEGIRRGLESADRGQGIPVDKAFRQLRQKRGLAARR